MKFVVLARSPCCFPSKIVHQIKQISGTFGLLISSPVLTQQRITKVLFYLNMWTKNWKKENIWCKVYKPLEKKRTDVKDIMTQECKAKRRRKNKMKFKWKLNRTSTNKQPTIKNKKRKKKHARGGELPQYKLSKQKSKNLTESCRNLPLK